MEKNRGNTVFTFVIVSIVLAVLLVGAVYFLKQRGDQARQDNTTTQTETKKEEQKPAEDKQNTGSGSKNDANTNVSTNDGSDKSSKSNKSSDSQVRELSVTGSEDFAVNSVMLFVLTFAITSIFTSRKQ